MLVLSRKVGQEIMIGDSIRLVVVEVRRGQVRLAFSAPDDVPIHRREVYRQVAGHEQAGAELRSSAPRLATVSAT